MRRAVRPAGLAAPVHYLGLQLPLPVGCRDDRLGGDGVAARIVSRRRPRAEFLEAEPRRGGRVSQAGQWRPAVGRIEWNGAGSGQAAAGIWSHVGGHVSGTAPAVGASIEPDPTSIPSITRERRSAGSLAACLHPLSAQS